MKLLDFKDEMAIDLDKLYSLAGILGELQNSIDQAYVPGLASILEDLCDRMRKRIFDLEIKG
jgi:hypothetical protein